MTLTLPCYVSGMLPRELSALSPPFSSFSFFLYLFQLPLLLLLLLSHFLFFSLCQPFLLLLLLLPLSLFLLLLFFLLLPLFFQKHVPVFLAADGWRQRWLRPLDTCPLGAGWHGEEDIDGLSGNWSCLCCWWWRERLKRWIQHMVQERWPSVVVLVRPGVKSLFEPLEVQARLVLPYSKVHAEQLFQAFQPRLRGCRWWSAWVRGRIRGRWKGVVVWRRRGGGVGVVRCRVRWNGAVGCRGRWNGVVGCRGRWNGVRFCGQESGAGLQLVAVEDNVRVVGEQPWLAEAPHGDLRTSSCGPGLLEDAGKWPQSHWFDVCVLEPPQHKKAITVARWPDQTLNRRVARYPPSAKSRLALFLSAPCATPRKLGQARSSVLCFVQHCCRTPYSLLGTYYRHIRLYSMLWSLSTAGECAIRTRSEQAWK